MGPIRGNSAAITRDALALKWNSPNLSLNGRGGQKQHGVDIYGADYLGRMTGIQCKRYEGPLKLTDVTEEVRNAEGFPGSLATLYMATTADQDSKLQAEVRSLSEQRSASGKFGVGVLFWEDIFTGLVRDHQAFAAHYPQLRLNVIEGSPSGKPDHLAAICLGYYGRHLSKFYDLTFGEIGFMAGQDPYEFQGILRVLAGSLSILPGSESSQLSVWLSEIDLKLFASEPQDRHYESARRLTKRFQDRVKILPSMSIQVAEANFIELGITIGFVYHSDREFGHDASETIFRQVAALFPSAISRLRERLSRIVGAPGYAAGPRLFGLVDAELRWGDAIGGELSPTVGGPQGPISKESLTKT